MSPWCVELLLALTGSDMALVVGQVPGVGCSRTATLAQRGRARRDGGGREPHLATAVAENAWGRPEALYNTWSVRVVNMVDFSLTKM